nr:hypothetical protein [Tanacetum cinerariifolium]GFB27243.1 hypothetical protein [Tanacetum cinerariifolium]
MVAILEKGEHNFDFHPMVDFLEASPLRRNLKLRDEDGISSLPDAKLFENITLMGYNISPNQKFTFQKVKNINSKVSKFLMYPRFLAKSLRMGQFGQITHTQTYVGEGSRTPTKPHHTPSFMAQTPSHTTQPTSSLPPISTTSIPNVTPTETAPIRQYTRRARIAQSSTLPPIADEPAFLVRDERLKVLEDREGIPATRSRDDAPIKGRSMDEGEATTERISDDTKEMATVLTSIDAATVLAGGLMMFALAVVPFPLL